MRRPDVELPDEVAQFIEKHPSDVIGMIERSEHPWRAAQHGEPWTDAQKASYRAGVRARLNRTLTAHEWAAMEQARQAFLSGLDRGVA